MDAGIITPTPNLVKKNQKLHNPNSPLLLGEIKKGDVVKEISEPRYIDSQQKLI